MPIDPNRKAYAGECFFCLLRVDDVHSLSYFQKTRLFFFWTTLLTGLVTCIKGFKKCPNIFMERVPPNVFKTLEKVKNSTICKNNEKLVEF